MANSPFISASGYLFFTSGTFRTRYSWPKQGIIILCLLIKSKLLHKPNYNIIWEFISIFYSYLERPCFSKVTSFVKTDFSRHVESVAAPIDRVSNNTICRETLGGLCGTYQLNSNMTVLAVASLAVQSAPR